MSAVEAIRGGPDDEFQKFRPLFVARDYDGVLLAFRARFEALGVSRTVIDEVSGIPAGYSAKLLSLAPIKRTRIDGRVIRNSVRSFGRNSLGPLLGTAGLVLVVCEDPEQTARMSKRLTKRHLTMVRLVRTNGRARTR